MNKIVQPILLLCALMFCNIAVQAQNTPDFVEIKGRVFDFKTKSPISIASIEVTGVEKSSLTVNNEGFFVFPDLPAGEYTFVVKAPGYENYTFKKTFSGNKSIELGTLYLTPDLSSSAQSQMEATDNVEMDYDTDVDVQDVSSVLSSYQDVFADMAAYNFSQVRFKTRGYDNDHQRLYMNGLLMNDMNTGSAVWSLWGGLNDATRNQESGVGLEAGNFAFGNIGGTSNLDIYASSFRPGLKATYSLSNRTYANRVMLTYSTGLLDNGWAFAFVGSRRWGEQGYAKGSFYDAWSYFASLEKRLAGGKHVFNILSFAAPTTRGVASGSTQEAYDLTGDKYYNPNLGYQNGKLRNNRVRENFEPVIMFNYKWQINSNTRLTASVGYRFGRNGYSALNWYDTPDPRPDYYRNLPSYYPDDPFMAAYYQELWMNPGQESARFFNYDQLYNVNYINTDDVYDASGNLVKSGLRAKYIIEDRRTDQKQLSANILLNKEFNTHIRLDAAIDARKNKTSYFKTIKDMMGGEYWYDIDQYAERDFGKDINVIQSDLNNPFRIVYEGDTYGYDYDANIMDLGAWAKVNFNYPHWEAYAALSGGYNTFYRDGMYKKGLFPDNSYGKAKTQEFINYGAKLGFTYKFSGWHYITANAAYIQQAPNFQDSYVSPRTRNSVVNGLKEENIMSADLSYLLRSPYFRLRLTGFFTRIDDQTEIISFYDDYYRSFGNYIMTGVDRRYMGVEFGAEYKVTPTLSIEAAACYGDYTYVSNPHYYQTVDNTEALLEESKVYWSGYKVSGTPQSVAALGINYNAPKYFYGGISANYFGPAWIDMNPVRRTDKARQELDPVYVAQEQYSGGFTVDAFLGLSFRIRYKYYVNLNLNVSNILNNQDMLSGGYEHMRISRDSATQKMTKPFDSRYFYMYGRNFFLNLSFRF